MKPSRTIKPDAPKAKPSEPAAIPATISSAQFEALAGVTERRLRQLADAGKLPQPKAGRWETVPSVRALVGHYRTNSTPDALDVARLEKLQAETALLEMTRGEREGDLCETALVLEYFGRAHSAMVSTIMAMTHLPIEDREAAINHIRTTAQDWSKNNPESPSAAER